MITKTKRKKNPARKLATKPMAPTKPPNEPSQLTRRIYNALAPEFSKYEILLETTAQRKVGGFVISLSFQGNTQLARQQRVWRLLEKKLKQNEFHRIVGILTFTPDERSFILTE